MGTSVNADYSAAWQKLGIGTKEKPGEIFPRYTKRDFDDLKTDYNNQYGYTVRIPQWDDIIHLTPDAFKSETAIKAEKKEALTRILESPAPEWARDYASAMTWIDDIQDTASIVIPLISLLARLAPKAMSKILPIAGWLMLGYDLLNLLNMIGRAPLTGMKSKRSVCRYFRTNPFSKEARFSRINRIKNYKPGLGDLIQALQVLDQFTGAGLSLGGVMGAITDSIFGAYRYARGDPVSFSFDPPDVGTLERTGARGMKAAAAISSQGQVFSETTHFWTYVTAALSSMALAGTFKDEMLTDLVENPMDMILPAPEPKNPLTIAVIEEAGLKVQDGVGWPFNGKKTISVSDYIDATVEPCRANFVSYSLRHRFDSYGFVAAMAMDSLIPQTILAIDPEAEYEVDDTDEMKVFWKMIKAPVLPTGSFSEKQGNDFFDWAKEYAYQFGNAPGILEIEEKLRALGIQFLTSYPAEPGPDFEKFWPKGWAGDDVF